MLRKSLQQMAMSKIRQTALREKFSAKIALGSEIGPLGTELWIFQAPFFSSPHFYVKSPPYEYILNINQGFFPKDSKTALGFEIGPLGTELWLFKHHFFQVLIFMSNCHHTSTYHKISIKDFFPRNPKLPSDLKLVHLGPSYGSANILLYRLLYRAFTIYEKYHPVSRKPLGGFQNSFITK